MKQDFAYAFRMIVTRRSFSALVILTLALGIGANTAVFSVFDAVLLRPLPFKEAERLVGIWESDPKKLDSTAVWNSYRDLQSWQRSHSFEDLAGYSFGRGGRVLRAGVKTKHVLALPVTPNFFSLLGVEPVMGRTFGSADKIGDPLVVVSSGFWRNH